MSAEDKETVPVRVIALRAESYSADGENIVISLRTKYSTAERKFSVPVECFQDLIIDLQRLQASLPGDNPADEALPLKILLAAE